MSLKFKAIPKRDLVSFSLLRSFVAPGYPPWPNWCMYLLWDEKNHFKMANLFMERGRIPHKFEAKGRVSYAGKHEKRVMKIFSTILLSLLAVSPLFGSSATRSIFPTAYTPGVTMKVDITVTLDPDVTVYALEETAPFGWAISIPDANSTFYANVIKSAIIFIGDPRSNQMTQTYTYYVTPPVGTHGPRSFSGRVSFNGIGSSMGGAGRINGEGAAEWDSLSSLSFANVIYPSNSDILKIPDNGEISSVSVYDARGGLVSTLMNSGYVYQWDGKNQFGSTVASGKYTVIVKSGGASKTFKVMVIK